MPSYNSAPFLEEAINSVLTQTYNDFELLIIDDCSTDESRSIVLKCASIDKRIKPIFNKVNMGPAKSRNRGLKDASGQYIAFLDADDLWDSDYLESSLLFLDKLKCSFIFSGYKKIDSKGNVLCEIETPKRVNYRTLLKGCVINTNTVILRKDSFSDITFPTDTLREDYLLWLKILKGSKRMAFSPCFVKTSYRIHDNQSSRNKLKMSKHNWIIYNHIEKLGLIKSLINFSWYAITGTLKLHFPNAHNTLYTTFLYKLVLFR